MAFDDLSFLEEDFRDHWSVLPEESYQGINQEFIDMNPNKKYPHGHL